MSGLSSSSNRLRCVELLRAGAVRSVGGWQTEIAISDLEQLAANYRHRTPVSVVIGYPGETGVSAGTVRDVFLHGDSAYALVRCGERLRGMVDAGEFTDIAVRLAERGAGPGYKLRQVGLLREDDRQDGLDALCQPEDFADACRTVTFIQSRSVIRSPPAVAPARDLSPLDRCAHAIAAQCPGLSLAAAIEIAQRHF